MNKFFSLLILYNFSQLALAEEFRNEDVINGDYSKINLESSKEKTKVKLSIYNNANPIHGFKLDLSGTIGDDKSEKNFADFDGLDKGVKLKMTYILFNPNPIQKASNEYRTIKKSLEKTYINAKKNYDTYFSSINVSGNADCSKDQNCKILKKLKDSAKTAYGGFTNTASSGTTTTPSNWYPEQYLISVAANQADFSVLNLEKFDSDSIDKTGIELGVGAQWLPAPYTRLKAGFNFQRAYEQSGNSKQYCKAEENIEGLTQCIEGNTSLVTTEYNRNLYLHFGGYNSNTSDILKGWDVQTTHNFADSKTGINIPLYFFASKSNSLNAGIKFGFIINGEEKDDDATISVFFGTALDIF